MTCSSKNVANAVGGKTARACDSCITKRARWYCAADDAFLCQACDSSVHSANSLARRHERVRLKTASYKSINGDEFFNCGPFSGFTKKARTPRQGKHKSKSSSSSEPARNNNNIPFHLVPELGFDEVNSNSIEENEAQLLYRVPIFDPSIADLCTSPPSVCSTEGGLGVVVVASAFAPDVKNNESESRVQLGSDNNYEMESFHGLLPSDIELAEFAADVESLLGRGLENECIGMEELGLIDTKHEESEKWKCGGKVKEEGEECYEVVEGDNMMEIGKESSFELNFDYDDSHETCEEVKEKCGEQNENNDYNKGKRKISLQLDYDAVIIAWDSQKCPWTNGDKPILDADENWPDCMGTFGTEVHYAYGEFGGYGCHPVMVDGGREARVSRYREKRRTRLFSKKIRYEVRKLNAEKRPRMKGRFVKRASFAVPTFPLLK
ncbi:putative transcription factor C2C2-CO-like family [Medicago truncatula]|uniref:Putative transcription factor C2C2-CO-like family n=1 Tax=Medicago truncatula TaxID=3880 RepID=A0A072VQB9_MEDTR|nr:zinc finger protein CONSTANS-LIKE 16 [Medicago truncatula]KEH44219.1 zinc finger constans-like protein [Medicago truncatula]RHN82432.1 putative transcription factor C2C2-CO-like family [Medicago truncatula]